VVSPPRRPGQWLSPATGPVFYKEIVITIGLLFWLIYVLAVLFGGYAFRDQRFYLGGGLLAMILFFLSGWKVFAFRDQRFYLGGGLLAMILFFLLGWKVFGFTIQG
jgi:hypothetical protein